MKYRLPFLCQPIEGNRRDCDILNQAAAHFETVPRQRSHAATAVDRPVPKCNS